MTIVRADRQSLKGEPASAYTWVPPGEPGAWGELLIFSSMMRVRVRNRVYAEPESLNAAGRPLELELTALTAASKKTAARIDEYIDELGDESSEEE